MAKPRKKYVPKNSSLSGMNRLVSLYNLSRINADEALDCRLKLHIQLRYLLECADEPSRRYFHHFILQCEMMAQMQQHKGLADLVQHALTELEDLAEGKESTFKYLRRLAGWFDNEIEQISGNMLVQCDMQASAAHILMHAAAIMDCGDNILHALNAVCSGSTVKEQAAQIDMPPKRLSSAMLKAVRHIRAIVADGSFNQTISSAADVKKHGSSIQSALKRAQSLALQAGNSADDFAGLYGIHLSELPGINRVARLEQCHLEVI